MKERTVRLRPRDCCSDVIEPPRLGIDEQARLLAVFKALADGTRLQIFRLIAAQVAPICACDIVDRFDVSQPTIAHHMKILREAGLVTSTKIGIWAYYELDARGAALLGSMTEHLLSDEDLALARA